MLEKESCLQQIKIQQLEGEDWIEVMVRLEAGLVRVRPRVREVGGLWVQSQIGGWPCQGHPSQARGGES
jgi:hypothetical protein